MNLIKNENDVVTYKSKATSTQFAVFSEIYYDKGWNAYIDGKLTPYAKVNYVLRGMPIPSGEHEIVFKFEPKEPCNRLDVNQLCINACNITFCDCCIF
ncbi:MAG: YfhO family protein [Chitinophagaceae bacterium]